MSVNDETAPLTPRQDLAVVSLLKVEYISRQEYIELSLLLRTPGIGIVFLKPSLSTHCVTVKFLPWTRPLQYIRYGFLPSTEKSCEDYAPELVTCSMISHKISPDEILRRDMKCFIFSLRDRERFR